VENPDREVLQAVFSARIELLTQSLKQAREDAATEWVRARAWMASDSRKQGSFIWYCQELDLEPDAVRKSIGGAH
jgi:hypothetical protein